ncbi:hypothetical protein V6N12_065366 [Hibiscus sabdariffa]|uniref:PB1-like domain-containing protein n=1 Tax=Hibiscus sabdariffa TaxID=183260 RepID=A0ABR2G9Y1_9ROSI
MKFTGKLVDHFDNLDVDTMSMFEVVNMVERLGFVVTVNVFWQLSDNPLEVKKLISDGDVLEMVRNVPRDHYLHIYIVEVEPDSNLEDEDCDVEPETRIESDSNSKEVEPETRIESDSNSEDEEYEVEDESSTDQSKFSDSENELASSEDEIFNVNVGLGSDEVELRRPGPRTTPTSQAKTTQTPSSTSTEPTQPNVFRWMPTLTVRTSQESSVSHSSPSPTPIPTQPSHPNVFIWMPTPGVPLSQDNCGSHLSPSPSPTPIPTPKPLSQDNCGSQSSPRIDH